MLFLAMLAFLRWHHGAPAPSIRKALQATIYEQADELASMRANITKKKILEGRVQILEEQQVEEREQSLKELAAAHVKNTILENNIERIKPLEKELDALKMELKAGEKREDRMAKQLSIPKRKGQPKTDAKPYNCDHGKWDLYAENAEILKRKLESTESTLKQAEEKRDDLQSAMEKRGAAVVADANCRQSLADRDTTIKQLEADLKISKAHSMSREAETAKLAAESQERSSEELKTAVEEKQTALKSLATSERKLKEQNENVARLEDFLSAESERLADMEQKRCEKFAGCEEFQGSLAKKDESIARLNKSREDADDYFHELKQSLGVPNETSLPELQALLDNARRELSMLQSHVCNHAECLQRQSDLEKMANERLIETIKSCEAKCKNLEAIISKQQERVREAEHLYKQKKREFDEYKRRLADECITLRKQKAIAEDAARNTAQAEIAGHGQGIFCLSMGSIKKEGELDAMKRVLEETKQEVKDRTKERDREQQTARNIKEYANRYWADLAQRTKERDDAREVAKKSKAEAEEFQAKLRKCETAKSELSLEIAQHSNQGAPSGRKRNVYDEEDKNPGDEAAAQNKRYKADE